MENWQSCNDLVRLVAGGWCSVQRAAVKLLCVGIIVSTTICLHKFVPARVRFLNTEFTPTLAIAAVKFSQADKPIRFIKDPFLVFKNYVGLQLLRRVSSQNFDHSECRAAGTEYLKLDLEQNFLSSQYSLSPNLQPLHYIFLIHNFSF